MEKDFIFILFGIIIGLIIGYLFAKIHFWIKNKSVRKDAIGRSKSVILGQVNEKIAPILPQFNYNYKDLVFIGKGIDYIVFDGLSEGNLNKIVFLEIKTGKSNLNKNEKSIKSKLEESKVEYEIMRI
ncbi:Holliday junction resolvase-like protein [Candidatus Vampirococcus lugosii]|uniref:Holliday junction resolvase-like protein n=1 Tax=Candidatus Vampirococcus lugosii TaxID=2789015 RepID=A0ABS5QK72_9BACT|nr:Holliday junction resolvase-like protein [Candidatus Vampirococcus lugosii]MBS8121640.1 Holliday junction resolvase-like protein [Candidatus Vampirococcus lugosii]